MKKIKIIAVLLALFSFSSLSASDFDWSECWCNYGGGLERGDVILNISSGLYYPDLLHLIYDNVYIIPPVMLELQYVMPIWKLPLSFGGYAGIHAYGYNNYSGERINYFGLFFGAEAAYHIMLPPESLDVYAVARIGGGFPIVRPRYFWKGDYVHFDGAVGATLYMGKIFGLNAEFGYPLTRVGVSLKF